MILHIMSETIDFVKILRLNDLLAVIGNQLQLKKIDRGGTLMTSPSDFEGLTGSKKERFLQMIQKAAMKYKGRKKLDLILRHPDFAYEFHEWLDQQAAICEKSLPPYLSRIGKSTRLKLVDPFVASDYFVVCDLYDVRHISHLTNEFCENFLSKVERNIPSSGVTSHWLTKTATDQKIIEELGTRAETHLADIWDLLLLDKCNSPFGIQMTRDHINIFFVRNSRGKLQKVTVCWSQRDREFVVASSCLNEYRNEVSHGFDYKIVYSY